MLNVVTGFAACLSKNYALCAFSKLNNTNSSSPHAECSSPHPQIKRELAETYIDITCYDSNGNVVKKVTSSEDGSM